MPYIDPDHEHRLLTGFYWLLCYMDMTYWKFTWASQLPTNTYNYLTTLQLYPPLFWALFLIPSTIYASVQVFASGWLVSWAQKQCFRWIRRYREYHLRHRFERLTKVTKRVTTEIERVNSYKRLLETDQGDTAMEPIWRERLAKATEYANESCELQEEIIRQYKIFD